MPGLDADTGILSVPIWLAGAAAALFLFVAVIAFGRVGAGGLLRAVVSFFIVVLFAFAAWTFLDRSAIRDRTAERQVLDTRAAQLTAQALAAGSPLACLDGLAGETIEAACEKVIFANPETVAAAVSYVTAKLTLIADGMEFASRADPGYANALAPLRLALESDRFGIVAHVLSVRDSCTTVQCPTLALVHNATRIQANLKDRTFESYAGRHAAEWNAPQVSAADTPSAGGASATTGHPVSPRYDFPSAASIPPVSIMSSEPVRPPSPPAADSAPAAASSPAAGTTPIPPRRPPPARAAQRPAAPAPPAAPRPITPPVNEQAARPSAPSTGTSQ